MPIGVSAGIGAALTGVSAIAGLFGKKQKQVTTPTFSPEQQQLQSAVSGKLQDRLNNPASLDPLKTAAASSVNRSYDGAATALESRLAARGFGDSGKLAMNEKGLQIARAGSLGNLESQFAALSQDQENKTLQMAGDFAYRTPGSVSTGTSGGGPGGAIGGASETASLLWALNHFMSPGGAPGGGGGGVATYAGEGMGSDGRAWGGS